MLYLKWSKFSFPWYWQPRWSRWGVRWGYGLLRWGPDVH